jgi:hypothetical protein
MYPGRVSATPEDICGWNECLCELVRSTLGSLSPTQKEAFSYWLLKLRSDRQPLNRTERRALSAHLSSLIGIIGSEEFDNIISGVLTIIIESQIAGH